MVIIKVITTIIITIVVVLLLLLITTIIIIIMCMVWQQRLSRGSCTLTPWSCLRYIEWTWSLNHGMAWHGIYIYICMHMYIYIYISWHVVSCRAVPCRVVSCRAVPCRAVSCRVVSRNIVPRHVTQRHVAPPCHVTSRFSVSLYYIMLCYDILGCTLPDRQRQARCFPPGRRRRSSTCLRHIYIYIYIYRERETDRHLDRQIDR